MSNIKTKDMKPKTVKTIDKAVTWTERIKDPIVYANEKAKDATDGQVDVLDYGEDKIKYVSNRAKDEAIYAGKKAGTHAKDKAVKYAKSKYQKNKLIKGKNKKNSSCSVRSVRNVKKYEDILTRAKLNNTSGKKGHRNTSCDNINITTYTSNYAKKNNSELILYLYEVYAKIEKSLKTNVDTKKILLRLKSKIQSVILQIKSNEKKGKFCLIEEKKEDKESKENGKANLCLKSHLILLKLFDVPKKVMYGDNEENCAINDVEYLTKIKSEEKIVISDFHINIVRSFFETLLMRLKIVNSKGVNIKYKKV